MKEGSRSGSVSGMSSGPVSAPVDLSDHLSVVRYLHDRFSAGDMETIRGFCSPDFKHFPGSMDESTPKGTIHPCGTSFIRPAFGFDDFSSQVSEMNGMMDWKVKPQDFFTSSTTSDIMVKSELCATGKHTGKKTSFHSWEAWKFNEKNQIQMLQCLYDPFAWKQIL